MKKRVFIIILFLIHCGFSATAPTDIIQKINHAVKNINNLTADIEYVHTETLFETQTVRTGKLFYSKDANAGSLRINFRTLQQDQSKPQQYREEYIFDGMKLTRIDYQSKSATTEVLATNKPLDPFELVQDYFPIIGLANPEELTQQFDIKAADNTLQLTPKENTKYSETYEKVEITIDPKSNLPVTFKASTTKDEEITVKLTNVKTPKEIRKDTFDIKIPSDFVTNN